MQRMNCLGGNPCSGSHWLLVLAQAVFLLSTQEKLRCLKEMAKGLAPSRCSEIHVLLSCLTLHPHPPEAASLHRFPGDPEELENPRLDPVSTYPSVGALGYVYLSVPVKRNVLPGLPQPAQATQWERHGCLT